MIKKIVILSFSLFFMVSCATTPQKKEQFKNSSNVEQIQNKDKEQQITNEQLTTHLEEVASQVSDVEDAVALIAGPYAVVAIDVNKNLDRQRVGVVKFSVSEALREDPYGKTAVVIADADGTERIRQMTIKMKEGEPLEGILNELAEIVGRYMPQLPVEEKRNVEEPVETESTKETIE